MATVPVCRIGLIGLIRPIRLIRDLIKNQVD